MDNWIQPQHGFKLFFSKLRVLQTWLLTHNSNVTLLVSSSHRMVLPTTGLLNRITKLKRIVTNRSVHRSSRSMPEISTLAELRWGRGQVTSTTFKIEHDSLNLSTKGGPLMHLCTKLASLIKGCKNKVEPNASIREIVICPSKKWFWSEAEVL